MRFALEKKVVLASGRLWMEGGFVKDGEAVNIPVVRHGLEDSIFKLNGPGNEQSSVRGLSRHGGGGLLRGCLLVVRGRV